MHGILTQPCTSYPSLPKCIYTLYHTHVPLFSVLQLKKAFGLKHYVLSELPIMLLKLNNPTTKSYIKLNLLIIILPQNLLTGNSQEVSAVKFVSVNQIK